MTYRLEELERHGRAYGELRLAIAFSEGLEGESAKRVTTHGWDKTAPLADSEFGAALLRNRGATRNPAVVLRPSGLLGIDVDGPDGVALLKRIVPEGLPGTVAVATGKTDGYHLWFSRPAGASAVFVELGPKTISAPEGLKVKSGQYLIAPPAIHPAGGVYRFAEGRAPWETPILPLPGFLLERLISAERAGRKKRGATTGAVPEGGRHPHLLAIGGALVRVGASLDAIEAALLSENTAVCQPPKATDTVLTLARDLYARYSAKQT
jgi:hypothetical protein